MFAHRIKMLQTLSEAQTQIIFFSFFVDLLLLKKKKRKGKQKLIAESMISMNSLL